MLSHKPDIEAEITFLLPKLGAVIGLVGGLANSAALVTVGTVLAIMAAVCQHVAGRAFIKCFSECDWLPSGNEYLLSTPLLGIARDGVRHRQFINGSMVHTKQ